MPLALLYVFGSVLTKFCATAGPVRLFCGQSASMFTDTGFTGMLNWLSSCVACWTHASEGVVVGIALPAGSFWISSVEEEKGVPGAVRPPGEKPYWLVRDSRFRRARRAGRGVAP